MTNQTALITGASRGLGRELALIFAREKYDVVLVSRSTRELEALKLEIEKRFAVRAHVFAIDLSSRRGAELLVTELAAGDIVVDVLVNNAGAGLHGAVAEAPWSTQEQLLDLLITSPLYLLRSLLPGMCERGRGGVLNIASLYSFIPVQNQALYAASKAFLRHLSLGVRTEVEKCGVVVTCVSPGSIETNFRRAAGIKVREGRFTHDAQWVAEKAFGAFQLGKASVVPGFCNKLYVLSLSLLPSQLRSKIHAWVNTRVRGLAHQSRS